MKNKNLSLNTRLLIVILTFLVGFGIFFLFSIIDGCSVPILEKVIKVDDKIKDSEVSCLEDFIINGALFKPDFKYDNSYPPSVTVYVTGKWNNLDDNSKEEQLKDVGRKWHECNPDNMTQVTIMAYDVNDMPVLAVYVMRGE